MTRYLPEFILTLVLVAVLGTLLWAATAQPPPPRQINPGEERLFMYECMKHQTSWTCFKNWDALKI